MNRKVLMEAIDRLREDMPDALEAILCAPGVADKIKEMADEVSGTPLSGQITQFYGIDVLVHKAAPDGMMYYGTRGRMLGLMQLLDSYPPQKFSDKRKYIPKWGDSKSTK